MAKCTYPQCPGYKFPLDGRLCGVGGCGLPTHHLCQNAFERQTGADETLCRYGHTHYTMMLTGAGASAAPGSTSQALARPPERQHVFASSPAGDVPDFVSDESDDESDDKDVVVHRRDIQRDAASRYAPPREEILSAQQRLHSLPPRSPVTAVEAATAAGSGGDREPHLGDVPAMAPPEAQQWYEDVSFGEPCLSQCTTLEQAKNVVEEWAKQCGFLVSQISGSEVSKRAIFTCKCKGRRQRATDTKNKHLVDPEQARKRPSKRAGPGEETCPFRYVVVCMCASQCRVSPWVAVCGSVSKRASVCVYVYVCTMVCAWQYRCVCGCM